MFKKTLLIGSAILLGVYLLGKIFWFQDQILAQKILLSLAILFPFLFFMFNEFKKEKLSWFFSFLRWLFGGVKLKEEWKFDWRMRMRLIICLLLILIIIIFPDWSVFSKIIWIFFAGGILFKWEPKISVGIGLVYLIVVAFLVIAKKEEVAQTAAVYAYYFLVIGVIEMMVGLFYANRSQVRAENEHCFSEKS